MKERIVGYLYAIAFHSDREETKAFLGAVSQQPCFSASHPMPPMEICVVRAQEVLTSILSDYDAMRVLTIDAFLQSLLSGMVQMLGGAVGYQVELNIDGIINEAVDHLLTTGARDEKVRNRIVKYMNARMSDGKRWDIHGDLVKLGKDLYNERLQQEYGRLLLDEKSLRPIQIPWRTSAKKDLADLQALLKQAERFVAKDFLGGEASYIRPMANLRLSASGQMAEKETKFLASFSEATYKKIADPELFCKQYKGSEDREAVRRLLMDIHEAAARCRSHYLYHKCITRYVNDLLLMGALRKEINRQLDRNNTRLLATTAATLYHALKPGDADFILEKAGIRYHHIMLDEFQDTSTLQWENFRPLLMEILSTTTGSALIVGDIKQSIYRWRNGDWTIMRDLQDQWADYYNTTISPLVRNFRSEREIVRFNLDTFSRMSAQESGEVPMLYDEGYRDENLASYYRAGHEGGYVLVKTYPQPSDKAEKEQAKQQRLLEMFTQIEELLASGRVKQSDIMILLRKNKEASDILSVFDSLPGDEYPHLRQSSLVSNDCFQLRFSRTVSLIVAAMRYVYLSDGVARAYLEQLCPGSTIDDLRPSLRNMSLCDLAEAVLQQVLLASPDYVVNDLAYLNAFRDQLRTFVDANGSDGPAFLRRWNDKISTSSIPSSSQDGIRMMTVHTSKGLQAPNVFIPFCDWAFEADMQNSKLWCDIEGVRTESGEPALMPVPLSSTLNETPLRPQYELEHHMQRIDNLNLLYVAFTRAAERLFIYASENSPFGSFCGDYEAGSLFWDTPAKSQGEAKKVNPTEPFSFRGVESIPASCYSTTSHIEFRQSQDSRTYGWDMAANLTQEPDVDRRVFGTICHDILSSIGVYPSVADAEQAVRDAVERTYLQGHIPTEALRDEALALLVDTVTSPDMQPYFTGSWRVLCEETILFQDVHHQLCDRRMDRVLWDGDRAIVLDYKFGHDDPKYDRQVRQYMQICRAMGASTVEGYLWLANDRKLQPVQL